MVRVVTLGRIVLWFMQVMLETRVRIACDAVVQFKKSQTALSTTERYFTVSEVCLIVQCSRRNRNGN